MSDEQHTNAEPPKQPDPFDISGRRDFGIITLVVLFLVLGGSALYLFTSRDSQGSGPAKGPELGPDDVASVGAKMIKRGDVEHFVREVYPVLSQGGTQAPPEMLNLQLAQDENFCRQFLGQMFIRESVIQYATSQGLFETEEFRKKHQEQVETIAVGEMLQRMMQVSPSEAEMRKFWQEDKRWFTGNGQKASFDEAKQMIPTAMGRQKLLDYLESVRKSQELTPPNWDGPVISTVTVGDRKEDITMVRFEEEASRFPDEQQADLRTPQGRDKLLRQIADRLLIVEDARRQGFDRNPKVLVASEQIRPNVAAELLARSVLGTGFEKQIEEKYEQVKTRPEYRNARYHVAHILVRMQEPISEDDKKRAEERIASIRQRILNGEDFAKIAMSQSDDTASGAKGGDLGVRTHSELIPEFANAIAGLGKGEISGVIRTDFGLHVVRALEDPQFSDDPVLAKAIIRRELMREGFQMAEVKAKESFPIFVNDPVALSTCGIDPSHPRHSPGDGLSLEDLAHEQEMSAPAAP